MDGKIVIGTEIDTKGFDKEIVVLEDRLNDIKATLKMADEDKTLFSTREIKEMEAEAQKLGRRIDSLKEKQKKLDTAGFTGMRESIENVGKSVQKVTKKVVKWGLAIFGIRSAYMAVRSAINTIAGDDEQLKADIDYMKSAIAYTLEPVVRGIVNLAKQLLFYIQYIVKAWTGKNIFENANKSLQSANKQAKALRKTMAGFDEMNILNNDGSVSSTTTPSFNLASPEDVPIPSWIKWIADNGDLVKAILFGIAGGLTAIHLGLKLIQGLGIAVALAGIVITMQKLIDFINDPSFENFIGILEGIALAVLGVAIAIGAWPVAIGAAIAFVIVEIVKHFDNIMNLFNGLISWMDKNVLGALRYLFGPLGDILYAPISIAVNSIKGAFESLFGGIKQVVNGIIKLFKGDFKGGIADVFGGLKSIMLAPINALISGINSLIKGINKISFKAPDWVPLIGGKKWGFNLPQIPKLAKGGIVNLPGKGVPIGGALTGEVSREGVIPLTDSQQMALLGEAIGRYITINANITNTMNGRVISRELQKINNESDFAFNR